MKRCEALRVSLGFLLTVALAVAAITVLSALTGNGAREMPTEGEPEKVVVIDAGHGGKDGGAVASDGTLEKDINLRIAKNLETLLRAAGYKVVMTRTDDRMLSTDGQGSAKMRDLKRRLEISSEYPDALTVSIHCNKFPSEKCKGMQVYCGASEGSAEAAEAIRKAFLQIDPQNNRQVKKADSSIYVLNRARGAAILVECGFLSNGHELTLLKNEQYGRKLALVIMSGIEEYYKNAS